jgi:maltose-binding protein MalE
MGFGAYVFGYDGTTFNTQDIGLGSEASSQAFRFLRDMYWTQMPQMPEAAIDRANMAGVIEGMQEAGQLAMTINGPWRINPLQSAGIDYGVAVLPTLPNGQPMSPFVGVQSMLVNAYSEQQGAALDLANFLAGTDSQAAYFQSDRKVPARVSAQQVESVASDPWVATWAEQAEVGTPMPNIAQMTDVWTPWAGYMDAIVAGNASDDEIPGYLEELVATISEAANG